MRMRGVIGQIEPDESVHSAVAEAVLRANLDRVQVTLLDSSGGHVIATALPGDSAEQLYLRYCGARPAAHAS